MKANVTNTSNVPRLITKKLEDILQILYRAIINNCGLYKEIKMETHAPQITFYPGSPNLPEEKNRLFGQKNLFNEHEQTNPVVIKPGTLLHRRWLWFAVHEDKQDLSSLVYPTHCKIYRDHPELYESSVLQMDTSEIEKIFASVYPGTSKRKYKIAEPKHAAEQWKICTRTLFEEFEGDPAKLLSENGWSVEKVYSWKEKQKKIRGYDPIPGWGQKLISLYFLYLAELGYVLPDNAFPADLHAQALMIQLGIFHWGNKDYIYSNGFAELIRKEISRICKEKKFDVVLVAHSIWLLGSQMCNGCSKNKAASLLCPVYEKCKGRVDTGSYAGGIWYKKNKFHTKGGERAEFGLPTHVVTKRQKRRERKEHRENIVPLDPNHHLFKK